MLKKDADIKPPSVPIPERVVVSNPDTRKLAVVRESERRDWIAKHRAYLLEKSLNELLKKHNGKSDETVPPEDMLAILNALSILDPSSTLDLNALLQG